MIPAPGSFELSKSAVRAGEPEDPGLETSLRNADLRIHENRACASSTPTLAPNPNSWRSRAICVSLPFTYRSEKDAANMPGRLHQQGAQDGHRCGAQQFSGGTAAQRHGLTSRRSPKDG